MDKSLDDRMDFDRVIRVHADGTITDEPDVWAPELYDGQVSSGWVLLNGYSGQDRYSGPIMHPSEFIGGRMERDILSDPGVYVSLVSYYTPEGEDDDDNIDGWAVARMVTK